MSGVQLCTYFLVVCLNVEHIAAEIMPRLKFLFQLIYSSGL